MAGHPFDRPIALGERFDAPEAHADFTMLLESQQAGHDGAVATSPAARTFDVVAPYGSLGHHDTSVDVLRPTRMWLPLGTSTPPVRRINQPTQTRQTFISS